MAGFTRRFIRAASTATIILTCAASSIAAEFRVVIKRIDREQRLLVVNAGQQERAIRVPDGQLV